MLYLYYPAKDDIKMNVLIVQPDLDRVIESAEGRNAWRKRLETQVPDVGFEYLSSQEELEERIASAEVVGGFVSPEALAKANGSLKWVHSWAAGPNKQLHDSFVRSGIQLTCSKGNGAIPLAEHAVMLMLMLQRDAVRWLEEQQGRVWNRRTHGELAGKTCAILGTGHSGADLAQKLKAFQMRVVGMNSNGRAVSPFDQVYSTDEMEGFLGEADFIVVTAPRTPATAGLLGAAEFGMMKASAFYICISRGGIADDEALLTALTQGRIAGAGLDAHAIEPLPDESGFWTAPNTIITPHNAATTIETHQRGLDIFIENLKRYLSNKPLQNSVDARLQY